MTSSVTLYIPLIQMLKNKKTVLKKSHPLLLTGCGGKTLVSTRKSASSTITPALLCFTLCQASPHFISDVYGFLCEKRFNENTFYVFLFTSLPINTGGHQDKETHCLCVLEGFVSLHITKKTKKVVLLRQLESSKVSNIS